MRESKKADPAVGVIPLSKANLQWNLRHPKHSSLLQDILSSVMTVFLNNNQTATAQQLFHEAYQADIQLSQHALNALLTAVGKTGDLEQLIELVLQMAERGFEADKYTCSAILNACQHADAGELAFCLWRWAPLPSLNLCSTSRLKL